MKIKAYIPVIAAVILSSNATLANQNQAYNSNHITSLHQAIELLDNQITNIDNLFKNKLPFYESNSIKSKYYY